MDLYKHAFRLSPMICSDLVADCFELAWDIRTLDMRAAPYDLADLGFEPVRIETPEGKAAYVDAQRSFAERGRPLRQRVIEECERLLALDHSDGSSPSGDPVDGGGPPRSVLGDLGLDLQIQDLHRLDPRLFDHVGDPAKQVGQVGFMLVIAGVGQ